VGRLGPFAAVGLDCAAPAKGHILRGSSARQSEYLTVRKPRPRRRVGSHERGGVCESLFCVAVVVVLLATCGEAAVAASDQLPYGELIATLWKPGER
jgi:hypothetical protein